MFPADITVISDFCIPEGRLIVAEETSTGKVNFRTYGNYMQAAGGFFISGLVLLVYILSIGVSTGTSWWLSYWLQQGGGVSTGYSYLIGYNKGVRLVITFYWLQQGGDGE